MNILTDINVNENITMLIVTHELDIAKRTQKTIRITDGMITETIMN
jgi:ABC-type lipoprotein export system ATPase subunit